MTRAAQVLVSNGSCDEERWGTDTRMIYSTVVAGGVQGLCHPGRCLPSHLICIHSIFCRRWLTPLMRHPQDRRAFSSQLHCCFIFHCKHVCKLLARACTCMGAVFDLSSYSMFVVTQGRLVVTAHSCVQASTTALTQAIRGIMTVKLLSYEMTAKCPNVILWCPSHMFVFIKAAITFNVTVYCNLTLTLFN